MKSYCYSVRDFHNGSKLIGGTLHARNLEEAAQVAIKRCGLTIEVSGTQCFTRIEWIMKGKRVYLNVNIHAGHHLDDEAKRRIADLPFD